MGNIKNIPEIRFPEFKTEWEHKPLHHYLEESKALNGDLKYDKTEVLSVSGELGCVNQIEHLGRSYAGASVHNYGVVETGDIVYTKSPLKANPFGIVKLNTGKPGIVSTLYAVYKVKEENATGEFIDYYFSLDANTNRYLRPLVRKGAKNDMKINNAYVLHDKIFAPSVDEQKKINSFLKVTDKRLIQLKEKKALLEDYKRGMMQRIFSKELRFKDENGISFPEWESKQLGTITSLIKDGTHGTHKESLGSPYYLLSAKNISEGVIKYCEADRRISKEEYDSIYKNYELKSGDILLTVVGSIGRVAMWSEKYTNIAFQRSVGFIRFKSARPEFIFQLMNHTDFQVKLLRNQVVSAQPGIYLGDIAKLKVELPCELEQTRIANFLSGIDHKINICQSKIEETKKYKKSLLQKMFCVQILNNGI